MSWGCPKKQPQTGGFNQQKFILTQSWRLGVRGQGVSRATLTLKPLGEAPSCLFKLLWLLAIVGAPWL